MSDPAATPKPAVPADAAALPSGAGMPLLGFGTWELFGDAAVRATSEALAAGYRHVDTATEYRNEREVGRAVRDAGRDGVFVTTKLPPHRAGRERETLERSLELLGTDAIDLWLVHWPPGDAGVPLWEQLVTAQQDGLARDIGVSNYSPGQLDELERATGVRPAVNQIPWSPRRFDRSLLEEHRRRGVVVEGYSGLKDGMLDDPVVRDVADRLGRTPAQVIVRWHLEHGVVVIPKSGSPERIRANADVASFTLPPADLAALDALGSRS